MNDTIPPKYYGKMIRDRIPEIIRNAGQVPFVSTVSGLEYTQAAREKLLEEAYELFQVTCDEPKPDKLLTESADVLEVVLALLKQQDLGLGDLLQRLEQRREERGGFEQGFFLESIGQPWPDQLDTDQSRFIFNSSDSSSLLALVRSELERSEAAWIASAFYTPGIINILTHDLNRFLARGGTAQVILSTMGNFTAPEYIEHLRDFIPGLALRVYHPPGTPFNQSPNRNFHLKAYLFRHRTGKGSAIIGSSNLTEAGFLNNIEWNYYTSGEVNLPLAEHGRTLWQTAVAEYSALWDGQCTVADEAFLSGYRERYRQRQITAPNALFTDKAGYGQPHSWQAAHSEYGEQLSSDSPAMRTEQPSITPNAAQAAALQRLQALRDRGARAAAVIAATGVGKTYLAALDFAQSGKEKILFIVHRENILRKASKSFMDVLGKGANVAVYSGTSRTPDHGATAVFAMIQTLSRKANLQRFHPGEFDYIVVDEFHHAEAPSYRKVIDYFQPEFLLGLTATPERMDGGNVLRLCENTIAYELRLLEAVDRGLLAPFQYFAVHDPTDYEQIAWKRTDYDEEQLNKALMTDTRTAIIAHNLRRFLPYTGKIKALAFCSSVQHAIYTAKRLTVDHGLPSLALVGTSSEQEREAAMRRLEDEQDPLNILCCVDIFNEGVDIPKLSHVLFLRPTQSFTIFLQQLGRGLRTAPHKEQLVVIDFVGNFKKSHVAPLALAGFTSVQDYIQRYNGRETGNTLFQRLPKGCFLSPDLEVQKVWQHSIRGIIERMPLKDRLLALYADIKQDLGGGSPTLMDFFAHSPDADPKPFIDHFGSWLKTKQTADDLVQGENQVMGTPAERFLEYLENDMNPSKSYKMVVLKTILNLPGSTWNVTDIARGFLNYYLHHRERIVDYDDLANAEDKGTFPLRRVERKLMEMPLKFLSNKEKDWFILDRDNKSFSIREELAAQWPDTTVRGLMKDRVEYNLARYFYRKQRSLVE
jgi:superfamily II DNA or RNA helicase/predicted house-cleaning noncanonical NTP pyrophosphatase (MazG superfamily)/HKD family nuclease